jgi:rSAM/selenodomain-associated transferase 2
MAELRFSIIIPVLNEAAEITELLQHLQGWREQAEIIVVDGGSSDGSEQLAADLCDSVVRSERGRARQMNAGALLAKGEYLLFLHGDTRLLATADNFFAGAQGAPQWGFCRMRLSGADWRFRMIETAMNLRSRLTRIATGDQCLFVSRQAWHNCGGFADIPLMEDIELSKRLRRLYPPHFVVAGVLSSSRRWEQRGIWSTIVTMWRLRLAYWAGAAPERLHRSYYG